MQKHLKALAELIADSILYETYAVRLSWKASKFFYEMAEIANASIILWKARLKSNAENIGTEMNL